MARTVIDVDDEALARAQEVLGTDTKVATVNAALRLAADMQRRQALIMEELDQGEQYAVLRDLDTWNGDDGGTAGVRVPA